MDGVESLVIFLGYVCVRKKAKYEAYIESQENETTVGESTHTQDHKTRLESLQVPLSLFLSVRTDTSLSL